MAAPQSVDDELRSRFIELHQRFPVALLIARIDECIQRQRVLIGSGDLLLDERADDPRLDCRQSDVHARSMLRCAPSSYLPHCLSLIHISEPTRLLSISYAV